MLGVESLGDISIGAVNAEIALVGCCAHFNFDFRVGLAHLLGDSQVYVLGDDRLIGGVLQLLVDTYPLVGGALLRLGIVIRLVLVLQSFVRGLRVHFPDRL